MNQPSYAPDGYLWNDSQHTFAHEYLLPELEDVLTRVAPDPEHTRVLDLGCGNGAVTAWLARRGFEVLGVEPLSEGIERARAAHPDPEFSFAEQVRPLAKSMIAVARRPAEHSTTTRPKPGTSPT